MPIPTPSEPDLLEALTGALQDLLAPTLSAEGDPDGGSARALMAQICSGLLRTPLTDESLSGALKPGPVTPDLLDACAQVCRDDLGMLGRIFEALVPRTARYGQGQYFTPAPLARHMADLLQPCKPTTVLDPAAGAGVLMAAVAERLPEARLIGGDRDPLCVLMARAGLSARGLEAEISAADFLAIPDLWSAAAAVEPVDAVICNPPYLRHHLIDKASKKALTQRYSARHHRRITALSTGYVYFMLEAIERLKPGGHLVFITPADFLDVKYGEALKAILAQEHRLLEVELFDQAQLAFDGVLTTSAITVMEKASPARGARTTLREASADQQGVQITSTRVVDLSEVDPASSWTLQFGARHAAHQAMSALRPRVLSDYIRTRRGIATGANGFFVMSQEAVDTWAIEPEHLRPVIASARDLPDGVLTHAHWEALRDAGRPVWLLDCALSPEALEGTQVGAYLAHGRTLGVHERYNCRTRRPWYRMEQVAPPDVIVTYMNRGQTRFVRNQAGCRVMSVFLNAWITSEGLDVERLIKTLNSRETGLLIEDMGRTYGGGLKKIEPSELLRLPMPELPGGSGRCTPPPMRRSHPARSVGGLG